MLPGLGALSNSGSMPITGGAATATATNTTHAGQNVGGINMGASNRGGSPVSPMLIVGVVVVLIGAVVVLKK
ncbi:hypothetical protein [Vibrio sp. 99-70-13A1]|uniref:hypothetical protein n=1 Tax=Vibrio sp. 99-70-13A1 TaxID=2607601 RepID=UPI0014939F31|nr:hypothetical protein [Vibrio sp. 99-70-13A1]NOH96276.1 hypothetical protein [Vibrio sp. 99-70-13A1]